MHRRKAPQRGHLRGACPPARRRGRHGRQGRAPRPGARVTRPETGATLHAVALGGGRGLHASLSALRLLTGEVTAVVTVADDGGSSGRLRRELGLLPPGDLRKALAALAGDGEEESLWSTVFQHRFGGTGAPAGHAVGNLGLAARVEL